MGADCYWLVNVFILLCITTGVHPAAPACESMTSCDLYSELQEHSKLIAGFSYNVKKADSALTQLRTEKISLTHRVVALEEELKEGENDTVLLTNQEAINKLTLQDKELETGIHSLTNKLKELKEEINVIYVDNISNNDEDLIDLQKRVSKLNKQVERLDANVKNHTENFGLITSPENQEVSDDENDQIQVSTLKKKHNRLEAQVKELTKLCGADGDSNSLDSLGIELETVKSLYDTLQDQVTELQDKCLTQNQQLDKMLEELTKRVEEMENRDQLTDKNTQKYEPTIINDSNEENKTVVRLSTPP